MCTKDNTNLDFACSIKTFIAMNLECPQIMLVVGAQNVATKYR